MRADVAVAPRLTPTGMVSRTQRIVRAHAEPIQRLWRFIDPTAIRATYLPLAPQIAAEIAAGQAQAAGLAAPYVAAAVGGLAAGAPVVVPAAFAGRGAAGWAVTELADLVMARMVADDRAGLGDAVLRGLHRTLLYASTEITDASRVATQVQMAADARVAGYERVVQLPACDRCILLTGVLYRFSTGFARHPRCDCHMVPVTREEWFHGRPTNTPRHLFESMTHAQQSAAFGAGAAAALRAGAEFSDVVNARRGAMLVAGRWLTRAGTTSRGTAGRRMQNLAKQGGRYRRSQSARPTAAQIVHESGERSREELVAELYRYGYIR